MINYNGRKFRVRSNSETGELEEGVVFNYEQRGNLLSCAYSSLIIQEGHLLGIVSDDGTIEMAYHQINQSGQIRTGKCRSTPEVLENGKIILHESWQWSTGEKGTSELVEV